MRQRFVSFGRGLPGLFWAVLLLGLAAALLLTAAAAAASPPVPTVSAPAYSTAASATTSFTVSWQASGATGYEVQAKVGLGGTWSDLLSAGTTKTSTTYKGQAGTIAYFRARAESGGSWGAWSLVSQTVVPTDDTSSACKYAGTWDTAKDASYYGGSVRYSTKAGASMSYAFSGSGVALIGTKGAKLGKAAIYLDGKLDETIDCHATKTAYRQLLFSYNWSASGKHTLLVKVSGTAGRPRVEIDAVAALQADTQPPTGSITIDGGAAYTDQTNAALTLTATAPLTVTETELSTSANFSGATWQPFASSASFTLSSGDGQKTIYARFQDQVGNVSAAVSATILLDTTAPVTTSNAPSGWQTHDLTVTLAATDGGSGMSGGAAGTWYALDSTSYTGGTSVAITSDGVHTLSFYSVDAAGNRESPHTATIEVDTTPPALSGVVGNTTATAGQPLTITASASDATSGLASLDLSYCATGSPTYTQVAFTPSGDGYQATIPASAIGTGTLQYYVTATDGAGNQTSLPAGAPLGGTYTITPQQPPVLASFSVSTPSSATAGVPFSVTITALDQYGNAFASYGGTVTLSAVGGTGTLTPTTVGGFTGGSATVDLTYDTPETITIQASDGSISGQSAQFNVEGTGPTSVSGTISQDTTWTRAGSPYVVTGTLSVASSATLIVQSGVVVKCQLFGGLEIAGTLTAQGTAAAPITFTSANDDSVGGALPGSTGAPAPGDWSGISLSGSGQAEIGYADVSYGDISGGTASGSLTISDATFADDTGIGVQAPLSLTDSTISGDGGVAVGGDVATTIQGCTITGNGNGYGMNLNAGYKAPQTIQATISDNTISSYQTGVVCTRLASLSGNDITDNGQAAILSGSALGGFATANTVSANGSGNAVWLTPEEGQVVADATLTPNIIWVLEPGTEGQPAGSGNLLSVAAGVTLTIEPGTVVKGEPVTTQGAYAAPGGLEIAGTLTAQGTAAAPITFTSANDDSVGGALPGSTGAPAPGDWSGISLSGSGQAEIGYADVSYGDISGGTASGSLTISDATFADDTGIGVQAPLSLTDSTISGDGGVAVGGDVATTIQGCTITGNGNGNGYGMNLNAGYKAPQTIQATISDNTISSYQTGVVCTRLASLSGNDITDNGQAAILSGSALGGFATANTVSANGSGNAVWLTPEEGQVVADATLTPNIIWVLEPGTEGQPAGSGNLLSVAAGVTLTIETGTVVKGEPVTTQGAYAAPGGLEIAGTLTAQGTAAAPITFTSANDDSVGGALPGSTGAPAPGDWSGISLSGSGQAEIGYADVSYGDISGGTASGSLTISDATFADDTGIGVQAPLSLTDSTISGEAGWRSAVTLRPPSRAARSRATATATA